MNYNFIYITAKDKTDAKKIGRILVEERLSACVNIIENMDSIYWWDGKVQEDNEVVLIAKTKESLVRELIERVKSLHSYSCPCVVALPITDGNKDFLNWIDKETK
jgi:periplasmic divalent cation tolerance protein